MGMRILFLCGCLEPGRDGVGDYTRRLAGALAREGNTMKLISIQDKFISKSVVEKQDADGTQLAVLRFRSAVDNYVDNAIVTKYITEFKPDLISFQFVPFSFHPKGLPSKLGKNLGTMLNGYKVQVMLHELWVGHAHKWSEKRFWMGLLQKRIIVKLLKTIKPQLINTHAPYYQFLLEKAGVKVEVLPLFANIPFVENAKQDTAQAADRNTLQTAVIFAGLPTVEEMEKLLTVWERSLIKNEREGKILLVGRHGGSSDDLLKLITGGFSKIRVAEMGALPVVELSAVLQSADFGISPVPLVLSEKSGTISAMKEHGLPVIITRMGRIQPDFSIATAAGVVFIDNLDAGFFDELKKQLPFDGLQLIAQTFSDSIKKLT